MSDRVNEVGMPLRTSASSRWARFFPCDQLPLNTIDGSVQTRAAPSPPPIKGPAHDNEQEVMTPIGGLFGVVADRLVATRL
jgi:hypothetical protein